MTDPALAERLLILNSVLYISDGGLSSATGSSVYDWANTLAQHPDQLQAIIDAKPGDMSEAEIRGLVSTIQADQGVYSQMIVADVTVTPGNPKHPDGSTVVNATIDFGGQPIILFKGTGGDLEWRDNGEAGYAGSTDTPQQQDALAYFQAQMANYPGQQAIVSGHSKGGNKAQYVGILAGGQVAEVYSFDGQGFNQAFLLKYTEEIRRYASNINSISSEHDFVNILFHAIPGSNQFYIDTPWKNTDNGLVANIRRWHSPGSMFTQFGDRLLLGFDPNRTQPDPVMGELDDFIAFAQQFMTKDDFAYLCYFAMSKFMTNPDAYGDPLTMPDGFDVRFLSLLRNYLDVKGIDPQDVFFLSSAVGTFAGQVLGVPVGGALFGAAGGATLALLLAATPSYGYTTVPRDFRSAVRQRLLTLVDDVEDEPWWDVTKWDVWYRIDHTVLGGVDFAQDENERGEYYRKMIDMNGTTRAEIERIFTEVANADQAFAGTVGGWDTQAQQCLQQLRSLTQRIQA